MTNFELIKSMNIEAMAKFINIPISCNDICYDFCSGCWYSCKHRNGELLIVSKSKKGLCFVNNSGSYVHFDSYNEKLLRIDEDEPKLSTRDIKIKELQDQMDSIKRELDGLKDEN